MATLTARTEARKRTPAPARRPNRARARRLGRYLFLAPLAALLAGAVAVPLCIGVLTAFQSYTLTSDQRGLVGFENFTAVLADPQFWSAVSFTLVFTLGALVAEMVLGTALALMFERNFPGRKLLFTCALFPIMIAPSFMATLWRLSLNSDAGPLAAVVRALGISDNLLGSHTVVPTLVAVDALHWSPMVMLLVYAGLQGVPQELYEAATVDGAGYWKTLRLVTAPIMVPTLAIAVFLRLIDGLKTFDTIYVLTGGGPGTQTTNINVYVYQLAFTGGNFGQAAATGLMFLITLLAVTPVITRALVPARAGALK